MKISQEILDKFSFIPKLAKNISKENNENLMKINNLFNIENDEKSSIYIDIKNLVLKIEVIISFNLEIFWYFDRNRV